ncbi:hypothetical protein C8R45DRAFT_1032087 [Mycena sanguinolenta]|nr:hypothetical protein C8R45DRAFT_1032087 [Mycena sanguinolenta]
MTAMRHPVPSLVDSASRSSATVRYCSCPPASVAASSFLLVLLADDGEYTIISASTSSRQSTHAVDAGGRGKLPCLHCFGARPFANNTHMNPRRRAPRDSARPCRRRKAPTPAGAPAPYPLLLRAPIISAIASFHDTRSLASRMIVLDLVRSLRARWKR